VGKESLDEVVNRLSSHNKEHDTAGLLKLGAEFFDGMGTLNRLSYRLAGSISIFPASASS
jgi:hypothetical protein